MNYPIIILLIEANLVGLFSVTLSFFLLAPFFFLTRTKTTTSDLGFYLFFFLLGFLKHYLGYITGLQTWYCEKRNREINKTLVNVKAKAPTILQNVQEGIAFIILSFIIQKIFKIKDIYFIAFLTGFLLHLLAEFSGIHTIFCKNL